MWVDKYRPKSTKQIIGQQGEKSNAKKLARWLQNWERNYGQGGGRKASGWGGRGGSQEDGSVFRAALLSGPPGVGKTTTAVLVCEVRSGRGGGRGGGMLVCEVRSWRGGGKGGGVLVCEVRSWRGRGKGGGVLVCEVRSWRGGGKGGVLVCEVRS